MNNRGNFQKLPPGSGWEGDGRGGERRGGGGGGGECPEIFSAQTPVVMGALWSHQSRWCAVGMWTINRRRTTIFFLAAATGVASLHIVCEVSLSSGSYRRK